MQWKQSYNDLCEEISVLEDRVKDLGFQLKYAYKLCYDGKMPGDTFSRMPLDKALESYDSITDKLNHLNTLIEHKQEAKANMEKSVGRMTGLENQVAYRRTIMRQTHRQIAKELGYTEGYVRNVSYRISMDEGYGNMRNVTFL